MSKTDPSPRIVEEKDEMKKFKKLRKKLKCPSCHNVPCCCDKTKKIDDKKKDIDLGKYEREKRKEQNK